MPTNSSNPNHRKGRNDHYLPQGYLRGFIDPGRSECEKPLFVFDLSSNTWSEKSPKEVGRAKGFYDYAGDQSGLAHPDDSFARFERYFPMVRQRLLEKRFKGWVKQKTFLLHFMQMMRARSPLFLQQQEAENNTLRGATVTTVGPGNQIALDSLELRPLPNRWVRNRTITQMREQIQKGPDWMSDFNWCLRYSNPYQIRSTPDSILW